MRAHFHPTRLLLSSFVLLHLLSSICLASTIPNSADPSSLSRRRVLGGTSDASIEARVNRWWLSRPPVLPVASGPLAGTTTTLSWKKISLLALHRPTGLSFERLPRRLFPWTTSYTIIFLEDPQRIGGEFTVQTIGVLHYPKGLLPSGREVMRIRASDTDDLGLTIGQVITRGSDPNPGPFYSKYTAKYSEDMNEEIQKHVGFQSARDDHCRDHLRKHGVVYTVT